MIGSKESSDGICKPPLRGSGPF